MTDQPARRSYCPIHFGLEIFGDRWSLLIIRDIMFKGKKNYGDFLAGEEKISTNILADRLHLLENQGIIARTPDPENRRKVVYTLAPRGADLLPMLVELIIWSFKHDPDSAASKQFVAEATVDRQGLIGRLRHQMANSPG